MKRISTSVLAIFTIAFLASQTFLISCSDDDEPVTYTVTFDANGGTPVPSAQQVEAGKTATAPPTNPTKAGYVFLFWHLSGASTAYSFQTPIAGDITLIAKWQEEATVEYWQVTWELNGGAWPEDDNHATQVVKGGTLAEPAAPARTGYTFEGWYKETALTNQVAFPYDVSTVTSDFTLYAKWEREPVEEKGIAIVASVGNSNFVLMADGSLYASGRNNYGQLGTGNNEDVEQQILVSSGIAAVYAGDKSTFIVKTDGSVLAAGYNVQGQLGVGDDEHRNNFTVIQVDNVKEIASGDIHTLLLKNDGSLWGSGNDYYGQMGMGGEENTNYKFIATPLTSDVTAISAGREHSIVLKKDGTVWGAGYGYLGALGEHATDARVLSFVQIHSDAKAIAANYFHSLILRKDGTVYGSGTNTHGQLGIGSYDDVKAFTQAIEDSGQPLTNVAAIATGQTFSLALKADGTLWAAGNNQYGQQCNSGGEGGTKFRKIASDVKSMSAGQAHCTIIRNDGTSDTYGYVNIWDQLGGNGTIHIKVNDTRYNQWIKTTYLYDRTSSVNLFVSNNTIATGGSGEKFSVKPGIYNLTFLVSNLNSVPYHFKGVSVDSGKTTTILYEWSRDTGGYRWTVSK